ncbi:hypothetical protein [Microbulbifer sp. THAF38]|uniref:hypothetical protein n=1 Tax=Microbulbifer sp. THAF38 TaxID=2587856 RepID=UPI001267BEF7|nr:hypothetical protein [Microbulbifer sp. THAF38]QFT56609.1 hypothetical protein FIU95_18840 [Microbulbifer sp. THAF38]
MSLWKRLWDTSDVIEQSVEAVIRTGDALVYTEEEKANFKEKILEWMLKWQQVTAGQNLTRRLLALAITFIWLLESAVALILCIWSAFEPNISSVTRAAEVAFDAASNMGLPVGVILTFYFAPNKISEAAARYHMARSTSS